MSESEADEAYDDEHNDEHDDDATEADPPVGYGNPPREHRFKKGNRRGPGRPKGSKNRKSIVREVAHEMHIVVEDGRRVRRSMLDLVIQALSAERARGGMQAFRVAKWFTKQYVEPEPEPGTYGYLVVREAPPGDPLEQARYHGLVCMNEKGEVIYDPEADEEGKKLREHFPWLVHKNL